MFLIINTAEKNKTTLIIFIHKLVNKNPEFFLISKNSFKRNYHQTEKLLPFIDKLFKKNKRKIQDLKGIAIIIGPGPFTALRIGIIIANTMAYVLKIPIAEIKLNEFKNTKELIELSYKKFKKAKLGKIAIPFYGKEPNITSKHL
ncbi:hypothetical protein CVV26_02135 [Candidatus Kuenenbacteria bacterium HGW-Kuenenbacteria-1]|uniref:Gcp-like domain-containing protein n=1 Tax=Candidatus Kuenenbacteria bacterium HGW-Kuenenbacteria-1 TaxID=2013812 RepID=A0A2N1UNA6_9BACT|nr:MAG: hypothetical protein CVV26_02135 [Candidatus Kuenenbacteria bacterium HGW-Kuenenbacteria-1]